MKYLFSTFFVVFFIAPLAAQVHEPVARKPVEVIQHFTYLEDIAGAYTFTEVRSPAQQAMFRPLSAASVNFGNTKSAFWFACTHTHPAHEALYLEINNAMLDVVDVYLPTPEGTFQRRTAGAQFPKHVREVDVNALLFALPTPTDATQQTYYIRVKSNYPVEMQVRVGPLQTFLEQHNQRDIFFAAYFGLMLSMALYNLCIFFLVRYRVYLVYSSFTLTIAFFYLHLKGYPYHWFWGNSPALNAYTPTYSALVTILMLWFANAFMDTRRYTPTLYKISLAFYVLFGACALLNMSGDYFISANVSQVGALVLSLYILYMAIRSFIKGSPMAKFYLIAWSIYLLGVVAFILQVTSAIPSNPISANATFIGTSLEVLLLSFALAYRINVLKKEKEDIQAENLRLVQEQNKLLEVRVKERTEELQAVNEELAQQQEEVESQRDLLTIQNQSLKSYQDKMSASVRAAFTIQQAMLPSKQRLDEILRNYFILNLPKDHVSGDFYWVGQKEDKRVLIVADCTGHGVAGALMTMMSTTLLDRIVRIWNIYEPSEVLSLVHEEIQNVLQQQHSGNRDGMDAAVMVWCEENGQIRVDFSAAKRPLYYLVHGESTIQKVAGTRKMIGGFISEDTHFTTHTCYLPKGSTAYLCTDGYADQNDVQRIKLSERTLLETLQQGASGPLDEQSKTLQAVLAAHMRHTEQRDDILVVGVQLG